MIHGLSVPTASSRASTSGQQGSVGPEAELDVVVGEPTPHCGDDRCVHQSHPGRGFRVRSAERTSTRPPTPAPRNRSAIFFIVRSGRDTGAVGDAMR